MVHESRSLAKACFVVTAGLIACGGGGGTAVDGASGSSGSSGAGGGLSDSVTPGEGTQPASFELLFDDQSDVIDLLVIEDPNDHTRWLNWTRKNTGEVRFGVITPTPGTVQTTGQSTPGLHATLLRPQVAPLYLLTADGTSGAPKTTVHGFQDKTPERSNVELIGAAGLDPCCLSTSGFIAFRRADGRFSSIDPLLPPGKQQVDGVMVPPFAFATKRYAYSGCLTRTNHTTGETLPGPDVTALAQLGDNGVGACIALSKDGQSLELHIAFAEDAPKRVFQAKAPPGIRNVKMTNSDGDALAFLGAYDSDVGPRAFRFSRSQLNSDNDFVYKEYVAPAPIDAMYYGYVALAASGGKPGRIGHIGL